jgi:hypothetical protein
MPPATPAIAAPLASRGVLALLAARPTVLATLPAEWPACFAVSSTALRAASTRPAPFFDRDEPFAFVARGFADCEASAPFADFAALDLRAFGGLRFVDLPRAPAGRVFVSAMVSLQTCFPIYLPERSWYPR